MKNRKKRHIRKKIFQILYLLVLIVFLVSCALLTVRLFHLRRSSDFYTAETANAVSAGSQASSAAGQEAPLSLRLSRFAAEYPDAAAWIQIPGTQIDYPVMLAEDNEFYLDHLPDGSGNALGSLFLDCRSQMDSLHLVIYGHNGSGGRMFGSLKQYEAEEYYTAHPSVILASQEGEVTCPVFSVRRVEADSDAYTLTFPDRESLTDYMKQAAEASLYPIGADLDKAGAVLTLSTCTAGWDQRLIVQALIPDHS